MAALGITVLKNNVPWGPFTPEQITDALARGDITLKYLAHAPGLNEWLPLGDVLDFVSRGARPPPPSLPPVPLPRELPPVLEPPLSVAPSPPPLPVTAPLRPPILPASLAQQSAPPPPPPVPSVSKRWDVEPGPHAEPSLTPASFFSRLIAFLIDAAILFVPLLVLFVIGALAIEIPAAWHHISHESRMEEWQLLDQNTQRLFWLVAIGFGWLYGAGLECSPSQATVGKRWMGIKVTDAQGERVSFLRATGRYAAKCLSALPCFLGFIAALFSSRGLAVHDRMSGTRVVKK